jgi:hypothetical protein
MDARLAADRDELIGWIDLAASLEHAICCQYLYAAFSLKQYEDEGSPEELDCAQRWKGSILRIARQEMAHLATTCNLLNAFGEAPYLRRPSFPLESNYFGVQRRIDLRAYGEDFLESSIRLEMPLEPGLRNQPTIGTLYARILRRLNELRNGALESDLFIGPHDAQVDSGLVLPSYPDKERANIQPLWDVVIRKVRNHKEAEAAIQRVREEGEAEADSHHTELMALSQELADHRRKNPGFAPIRDVATNPCYATEESPSAPTGCQLLTNATAVNVAAVFDLAYEVLLRMLMLFFSPSPLTRRHFEALQGLAFVPMMSLVIRPLGELLTYLPAVDATEPLRAGATFRCPLRIDRLPDATVFSVIERQLAQLADRLLELQHMDWPTGPLEQRARARCAYVAENAARIHRAFREAVKES